MVPVCLPSRKRPPMIQERSQVPSLVCGSPGPIHIFADDFHGNEEFDLFWEQIQRVLPESSLVELDISHPIFHCFYDIPKIIQVTNDGIAECRECDQWENGPSGKVPKMFAVLDQRHRISVLMAWNTDLGDGLEWADDRNYPTEYATFAFKFLTNLIVYTMSH